MLYPSLPADKPAEKEITKKEPDEKELTECCPFCNHACKYEQAYVGGHGYCWRRRCTSCNYFDRWRN